MAKYIVDGQDLASVADAIREKTGESGTMTLAEMPEKIASISGGGGIQPDGINIDEDGYVIMPRVTNQSYYNKTIPGGTRKWRLNSYSGEFDAYRTFRGTSFSGDAEFHFKVTDGANIARLNEFMFQAKGVGGTKTVKLFFEGNRIKPTTGANAFTPATTIMLYQYGEIDLTNCPTSGAFQTNISVKHVEFCPNTNKSGGTFNTATLDKESVINIANSLNHGTTGITIAFPLIGYRPDTIIGRTEQITDVNGNTADVFIEDENGAMTLAQFINDVKGWSFT